jgi:hypothetical protein
MRIPNVNSHENVDRKNSRLGLFISLWAFVNVYIANEMPKKTNGSIVSKVNWKKIIGVKINKPKATFLLKTKMSLHFIS